MSNYNQAQYQQIISYIHKFSQLLTNADVKHWLDFGTLLHTYRDGGVLNNPNRSAAGKDVNDTYLNDDDFDISCIGTDYDKVIEVCKENNIEYIVIAPRQLIRFTREGLASIHKNEWPNRLSGDYDSWIDMFFWVESPSYDILVEDQIDMASGSRIENVILNLPKSSLFNWTVDKQSQCDYYWITKKYFVQELDSIQLYGFTFPAPRYIERHLEARYGTKWKTPMTKGLFVEHFYSTDPAEYFNLLMEDKISVFIEGVWDLFHQGHVELLKRAHDAYDKVIVGVASDELAKSYKRSPIIPYSDRVKMLECCKYVDEIYHNAPCMDITESVLDSCGADYSLRSVKDASKWREEVSDLGHGALVDTNRVHFLSYTKYHSTDIINKILDPYYGDPLSST